MKEENWQPTTANPDNIEKGQASPLLAVISGIISIALLFCLYLFAL